MLAEVGEVEGCDDVLVVGGVDFEGDFVGGDGAGVVIEPDVGAEVSAIFSDDRLGVRLARWDVFLILHEGEAEVLPEIEGPGREGIAVVGIAAGAMKFDAGVGGGEVDTDAHLDRVAARFVVFLRLLRAVAESVLSRVPHDLSEGREEFDFGDIRPGFRQRQVASILREKRRGFVVIALAEEVGVADGLAGQRKVKGKRGRSEKQARHENCGDPTAR